MGEIKSTLDLVMARTRHLSLSDEEKARQQKEAFDRRLQGLLQQVADGALTIDAARDRIAALQAELSVNEPQMVAAGIVGRIDPERNNRVWLDFLSLWASKAAEPVKATLSAYREHRNRLLQEGEKQQRERLAQKHAISGTAVMPNPLKEPGCREHLGKLRQDALAEMRNHVREASAPDQT